MKLRDLLNLIQKVAVENKIATPYIVGGVPRDKIAGILKNEVPDLDITNGSASIANLAVETEIELKKHYSIKTQQADDGHRSLIFPGNEFKLDFSSHAVLPKIDLHLHELGIKNPSDMQRECFSRDFYCNTLLLSLDLKKVKDSTHQGIKDIKNKIIRTCLDPDTTFRFNTHRIIRVIYLAAKLDFDVDPEIIKWISGNKDMIRLSSDSYLKKNLDKAMNKNPERAVSLISKTNLWDAIPITEALQPYFNKKTASIKVARRADDLNVLKQNVDNYIHFSNSDRFGISYHKNIHPGNPRGVYGFPLDAKKYQLIAENKSDIFYDYGYSKYIYIFNVSGNILDMDNINLAELANKVRQFVRTKAPKTSYYAITIPEPIPYRKDGTAFLQWIGQVANDIYKNEHSGINILLRGIGYDALETRYYGFGDDIASEIAVINPSAINLIAKINNPMLSKEDLKDIRWKESPEYLQQLEEKVKIREQEHIARIDRIKMHDEEKKHVDELSKQLFKDKKYDESLAVVKDFNAKWNDAFASKTAQLKRNFDLGEGFYANMNKYDSVADFRKKRRNKRKKILQKIRDMKLK